MDQSQISAEVERVTFRNEDNGWTVTKMRAPDGKMVTVTGAFAAIAEGQSFELFGAWTEHPHYGRQFKVERSVPIRPNSEPAILRYLSSGFIKGIGPKTAKRIVDHFGLETLDILDHELHRLREVPSIGLKKVATVAAAWRENKAVNEVLMFLNAHGVSPLFAQKICKFYGEDAVAIVSRDPYRLAIDIHGIGFLTADKIAQQLGIAADSQERIRAAIVFQLRQAEDQGHCFLKNSQLLQALTQTLGIDEDVLTDKATEAIGALNQNGFICSEHVHDENEGNSTVHYRMQTMIAEVNIAHYAGLLMAKPIDVDLDRVDQWISRYSQAANTILSQTQLKAIRTAISNRVFILTGGPGVGKTTTANAIIKLFKAMGKSVALCAPTGRAAQRLSEVAGEPAKTIHRLLEWNPKIGGFNINENNPLTVQALVVDEASMLDVHLADSLFRGVSETAQIVLIGDVDQLPSVGPGSVLADLISSEKIPYVKLNEVFRQAATSNIVQAAHAINNGEHYEFDDKSDCRFLEVETPEQVRGVIKALLTEKLKTDFGYDPYTQVQILTPMNRGDLGAQVLNEDIQDLLNPKRQGTPEFSKSSVLLRPGDRVIQSANNYDLGVFNGDIGFVRECNVDGGALIIQFGERLISYKNENIFDLKLAYAITIHKSQGSEFPVVIIPMTTQHFIMLQRNLVYTALTRAKKLAIFVGTRKALALAIKNRPSSKRQTLLLERLQRVVA